jgi:membrane fusion protein (multidrug efflux system)
MSARKPSLRPAALVAQMSKVGLICLIGGLLSACPSNKAPAPAGAGAASSPPPPEVAVITTAFTSVPLTTELPGRAEAYRVAQVRARVAGILQKKQFTEGSEVAAEQALFQIDSAPYKATLTSAQASLAKAEANLTQAQAQAERYKPLVEAKAISQQEYVSALAAFKQAQADVAVAKANIETAQLNVNYAAVRSPIAGRIGRALVTEGALVGQGEATPLAVVQQIDPMYVNFTQSSTEVMRLRSAMASGKLQNSQSAQASAVTLVLEDGSVYPQKGQLLFSDLTVDASTGQVTLRAKFPNPKASLLPGMFVRIQTQQATASQAILLPQQAVLRTGETDTVKVVDAEGKVGTRKVKLSGSQNGQWIVLDGLKEGEMVIAEGFQKMKGDAPVKPVPWKPANGTSAANETTPAAKASARP